MNTQSAIAIGKSLHDLNVKALCHTHLSDLKAQLESFVHPSQRAKINRAIADAEFRIKEIEYMETLSVGQWVSSDMAAKPGQITDLGYAGQIPEAMVQWWGASVAIPERPLNLTGLSDDQMLYCWNHNKFPKLVRRFDQVECKDVEVLQEKLQEAAYYLADAKDFGERPDLERDYQLQVTYCTKRIAYLTTETRDRILILDINRNGGTQQRTNLNHEVVKEYAEAMRQGDKFPPVKLTYDGTSYWLTDGFHTTEAAWSIGETDIEAIITKGSQRDAILASVGVNSDHGLRRSNADKRRAVTTLLEDEEWGKWSDREIARRCKVSNTFVSKLRNDLTVNVDSENSRKYTNKHGNVREMNIENIGAREVPELKLKELPEEFINEVLKETTSKNDLQVDQIVRIKSDRSDKRLIGYHMRVGVVTQINPASVNLKVLGQSFENVSPNDLEILDQDNLPPICFSPTAEDYKKVLIGFDSAEEILKTAILRMPIECPPF
jgi:hypothetical protein